MSVCLAQRSPGWLTVPETLPCSRSGSTARRTCAWPWHRGSPQAARGSDRRRRDGRLPWPERQPGDRRRHRPVRSRRPRCRTARRRRPTRRRAASLPSGRPGAVVELTRHLLGIAKLMPVPVEPVPVVTDLPGAGLHFPPLILDPAPSPSPQCLPDLYRHRLAARSHTGRRGPDPGKQVISLVDPDEHLAVRPASEERSRRALAARPIP